MASDNCRSWHRPLKSVLMSPRHSAFVGQLDYTCFKNHVLLSQAGIDILSSLLFNVYRLCGTASCRSCLVTWSRFVRRACRESGEGLLLHTASGVLVAKRCYTAQRGRAGEIVVS